MAAAVIGRRNARRASPTRICVAQAFSVAGVGRQTKTLARLGVRSVATALNGPRISI